MFFLLKMELEFYLFRTEAVVQSTRTEKRELQVFFLGKKGTPSSTTGREKRNEKQIKSGS